MWLVVPSPEAITARLQLILDDAHVPGATWAIVTEGKVAAAGALGSRDPAAIHPVAPDDTTLLYSLTKTLLATTVLQLAEDGLIQLDGPASGLLPELPGRPIPPGVTIRRLLNHTAGLPDYGSLPEYAEAVRTAPTTPWSDAEFLDRVLTRPLLFAPGAGWAYSNAGYLLIRRLIEHVTGRTISAAVAERLIVPLGLRRTSMATGLADTSRLMSGWSNDIDVAATQPDQPVDIRGRYHPGWVAHGTAISTASETALLLDAIMSGRVIGPGSLAGMLDPVPVPVSHPIFRTPSYGLGVMMDPGSRWPLVAGHAGGGPGYSTAAFHIALPSGPTTIAVLANRSRNEVALRAVFALADGLADGSIHPDLTDPAR